MLTRIREIIERQGLKLEETVYRWETKEILDYPLTIGNFFENLHGMEKGKNFYQIYEFYKIFMKETEKNGILYLKNQMEENQRRVVEIKKTFQGECKKIRLNELQEERRNVRQEMNRRSETCFEAAIRKYGENMEELFFLEYKNRVMLTSFKNIAKMIPELAVSRLEELWQFPWLTTNLEELRGCIYRKEPLGIVGGPCLFGIDEVLVRVETTHETEEYFDCSCGRRCAREAGKREWTLREYIDIHQRSIKSLSILNRKTGVTRQEFISLLYVFETASLLAGKVVIPLPDLSYLKYMASDVKNLEPVLKEKILNEFEIETEKISDLFLELIEVMKTWYPKVDVMVLHQRDQNLCRIFYDKRERYIKNSSYMRKLTNVNGREDAVVDYITMLALPYYLYGTRHIIQLDSLDETDSGRKCQKIHGDEIRLHSMLYPELISRDRKNTIYNTQFAYKDYLKRGGYEKWLNISERSGIH